MSFPKDFLGQCVVEDVNGCIGFADSNPLGTLGKSLYCSDILNREFASGLDAIDPLAGLKEDFLFPRKSDFSKSQTVSPTLASDGRSPVDRVIYFVGNSLGLQPRLCQDRVSAELNSWATRGVNGHFEGSMPWLNYDTEFLVEEMANLVGANPAEVSVMNSLTVNLHLLFIRFMGKSTPDNARCKILVESKLFPSDYYALVSELRLHGFDNPDECIVHMHPREGEHCLRTEDIVRQISGLGDELAMTMFSGVQFYTGQLFDIAAITAAVLSVVAKAIWDLAHAVGNVDMYLHDWNVDGACWCTYKYLNSGPGGIGGFFIHENHFNKPNADRLLGWWSHNVHSRFEMSNEYDASVGASEFRLSNVPILSSAALLASLDVFKKTNIQTLRAKSILLTSFLEALLQKLALETQTDTKFNIITSKSRGAQLSILFESDAKAKSINRELERNGVMVDYRKPGLIRAAPAPLYCSFVDVFEFYEKLKLAIIAH